jgi:hypothetical protein
MSNLLIFQVRQITALKLQNPNISDKERRFHEKVLEDLPDCTITSDIRKMR